MENAILMPTLAGNVYMDHIFQTSVQYAQIEGFYCLFM